MVPLRWPMWPHFSEQITVRSKEQKKAPAQDVVGRVTWSGRWWSLPSSFATNNVACQPALPLRHNFVPAAQGHLFLCHGDISSAAKWGRASERSSCPFSPVASAPATLTTFAFSAITRLTLWTNPISRFYTHTPKKILSPSAVAGPVGRSGVAWDDAGMHDASSSAGPSPPPADVPPPPLPVLHHQCLHLSLFPLWGQAGAGAVSRRGVRGRGRLSRLRWPQGHPFPTAAATERLRRPRGGSHRGQDRSRGFGVCGKPVFSTGSGDCGHFGGWSVQVPDWDISWERGHAYIDGQREGTFHTGDLWEHFEIRQPGRLESRAVGQILCGIRSGHHRFLQG